MKTEHAGMDTRLGTAELQKVIGKTVERVEYLNRPLPNEPAGGSRDFAILHFTDGMSVMFKIGGWKTTPGQPLHLALDVVIREEGDDPLNI